MKLNELKINSEFRDLLPPLTNEEYSRLEKNVLRDGKLIEPIWTWHGFIVDGHNRYKICTEHKIEVPEDYIITLTYNTKEDVFQWMIDTQLGRRNLTAIQKIAIAEKYRPIYEAKARENMTSGINQYSPLPNLVNPKIDTTQKLADISGVSKETYRMGAKILGSDNAPLKQEVLSKQKSISSGYNELIGKVPKPKTAIEKSEQPLTTSPLPTTKKCLKCKEIKPVFNFNGTSDFCNECMKNIYAPIPKTVDENSSDITKFLKTQRNAKDYTSVEIELESVFQGILNSISYAGTKIFFDNLDISLNMKQENINYAIGEINEINEELKNLQNKIESLRGKIND